MKIPNLEQMISANENRGCKNCKRPMEQHVVVFVEDGPYTVVPTYRCRVDGHNLATRWGDCQYEEEVLEC